MHEYLKDTILECGKSTYHVSLVRHAGGRTYLSIKQVIRLTGDRYVEQTIKINPDVLGDVMEVLSHYCKEVDARNRLSLTDGDKEEVVSRYMKMVPISDIANQFNRSEDFIAQVLRNRNVAIVGDNNPTVPKKWDNHKQFRKRKP